MGESARSSRPKLCFQVETASLCLEFISGEKGPEDPLGRVTERYNNLAALKPKVPVSTTAAMGPSITQSDQRPWLDIAFAEELSNDAHDVV